MKGQEKKRLYKANEGGKENKEEENKEEENKEERNKEEPKKGKNIQRKWKKLVRNS